MLAVKPGPPQAFIDSLLENGKQAAEQGDVDKVLRAWSDIRTASDALGLVHPNQEIRGMLCTAYLQRAEKAVAAGSLSDTLDAAAEHVRWGGERGYLFDAASRAYARAGAELTARARQNRLQPSDVGALVTAVVVARQMGLHLDLDPIVTGLLASAGP